MDIIVSISFGLFIYACIVSLFYKRGAAADAMSRRLVSIVSSDKKSYVIDEELSKPLMERFVKPLIKSLAEFLGRFIPSYRKTTNAESENSRDKKLKKMLVKAGLGIGTAEFHIIRLTLIACLSLFFTGVAILCRLELYIILLAALFGVYTGYAVMRYYLTITISKRKKSMERQLPDVLDLLSVSVEAGLGFEQAVNQITSHFEGPLIDELAVTYREMSMGRLRRDALILLGERCDLEEIKSFVGALVQASQLGISMKNVLRAQATAMRQARRNKIEEKAMKISVKILIPMVVFIFPVIFIVLLGPAAMNIITMLG